MNLLEFLEDDAIAFVQDEDDDIMYRVIHWYPGRETLHVRDEDTMDEIEINYENLLTGFTFYGTCELPIVPIKQLETTT